MTTVEVLGYVVMGYTGLTAAYMLISASNDLCQQARRGYLDPNEGSDDHGKADD